MANNVQYSKTYPDSDASYNTQLGNGVCLFYNAPDLPRVRRTHKSISATCRYEPFQLDNHLLYLP